MDEDDILAYLAGAWDISEAALPTFTKNTMRFKTANTLFVRKKEMPTRFFSPQMVRKQEMHEFIYQTATKADGDYLCELLREISEYQIIPVATKTWDFEDGLLDIAAGGDFVLGNGANKPAISLVENHTTDGMYSALQQSTGQSYLWIPNDVGWLKSVGNPNVYSSECWVYMPEVPGCVLTFGFWMFLLWRSPSPVNSEFETGEFYIGGGDVWVNGSIHAGTCDHDTWVHLKIVDNQDGTCTFYVDGTAVETNIPYFNTFNTNPANSASFENVLMTPPDTAAYVDDVTITTCIKWKPTICEAPIINPVYEGLNPKTRQHKWKIQMITAGYEVA